MYLAPLKTMLVEAIKRTFDGSYPEQDFRNVHCSIEYPIDKMSYPGVWVDYTDADKLKVAGVDHKEYSEFDPGEFQPYTRWKYSGYASFTVTALTSWERDRLYDELVATFAFGKYNHERSRFRQTIENNEFIAANFDFDEIEPQGNTAAPGTPWGTDEIIYERTINMEVIGEFVSDNNTGTLLPLSAIGITGLPLLPGETLVDLPDGVVITDDPLLPSRPLVNPPGEVVIGDGFTDWH